MSLDGLVADMEVPGDLRVSQATCYELEDFNLASSQGIPEHPVGPPLRDFRWDRLAPAGDLADHPIIFSAIVSFRRQVTAPASSARKMSSSPW
jgi:hypothetical protein